MIELNLPHQEPIRFAKCVVTKEDTTAVVKVKFDSVPSLAMLVESAAQSSAAFSLDNNKMGFLVTLKNIQLLSEPTSLEYDVKLTFEHQLETLTYFKFEVNHKIKSVATGIFVISLQ